MRGPEVGDILKPSYLYGGLSVPQMIYYYETGAKELFNIKKDVGETTNLASLEAGIVKRLSKKLGKYLRSTGGQRPVFTSTGKAAPWPDEI